MPDLHVQAKAAIIDEAAIEADLADHYGLPVRPLPEIVEVAAVELVYLLVELENPTEAGIGARREKVIAITAEIMRDRKRREQ